MRYFALLLSLSLHGALLSSQTCLPNGIQLLTQQAIDDFPSNFPDCTEIGGNVYISTSDIQNLDGLSQVTAIGGYLYFADCSNLNDISGLANLTTIAGYLSFSYCHQLHNLNGLNKLEAVGGFLDFRYNDNLENLEGLENLESVGGSFNLFGNPILEAISALNIEGTLRFLSIAACPKLSNLHGLEGITEVTKAIAISDNAQLSNLEGLNSITQVGLDLKIHNMPALMNLQGLDQLQNVAKRVGIYENPNLVDLQGLEALQTIGGSLFIYENPQLNSLNGLDGLNQVGGSVRIEENINLQNLNGLNQLNSIDIYLKIVNNPVLVDISALSNLDESSLDALTIRQCELLSDCAIESVCNFLADPMSLASFKRNGSGCASRTEVELHCPENGSPDIPKIHWFQAGRTILLDLANSEMVNPSFQLVSLQGQILQQGILNERTEIPLDFAYSTGLYWLIIKSETRVLQEAIWLD